MLAPPSPHAPQGSGGATASGRSPAAVWLRILWIGIPVAYAVILALFFDRVGLEDHDQHLVFHELQFWNSRLFGWAKQWTPVMCGGLSMAADPQVPLMSLGMMLGYLVGPLFGLRLATIAYLALGWIGGYLYAGLITRNRVERLLAASLFIGNGFFASRLCKGHVPFLPFLTLPLMLWLVHAVSANVRRSSSAARRAGLVVLATLSAGAALSIMFDGAPQVIIYYLPWVFVYAATLSVTTRSTIPLVVSLGAVAIAVPLGAGYLLPMLAAQREFPRVLPDQFTNPLTLPFFLLLPVRGRIIPAPGGGHEYSVFIGPALAAIIWIYRRKLLAALPSSIAYPWLVTVLFAFVFGVGSLKPLGVPWFLSPFDLLRPLPGFRSIGITGRYWGFLALPLAMLAALALTRLVRGCSDQRKLAAWMSAVLVLQLGFQVESVAKNLVRAERYEPVPVEGIFAGEPERIEYVRTGGVLQGELITPTRGVIDCYDNSEFIRPEMEPGADLVRTALDPDGDVDRTPWLAGAFLTWNEIRLRWGPTASVSPTSQGTVVVVLNQAYNRHWHSSGGRVFKADGRRLGVAVPPARLHRPGIVVRFDDPMSTLGVRITKMAWGCWAVLLIVSAWFAFRRGGRATAGRPPATGSAA